MATLSELRRLLSFGMAGYTSASSGAHSNAGANLLQVAANSTAAIDLTNIDGTATEYGEIRVAIACSAALTAGSFGVIGANEPTFAAPASIPYALNGAAPTNANSVLTGAPLLKNLVISAPGYRYIKVNLLVDAVGGTISTTTTYLPVARSPRWLNWLGAVGSVGSVNTVTTVSSVFPGTGAPNLGKARGGASGTTDTFVPSGSIVRNTFAAAESSTNGQYTIATGTRLGMPYVAPAELGFNYKLIAYSGNGGLGIRGSATKKIRIHRVWAEAYYTGTPTSVALLLDTFKGSGLATNVTTPTLINMDSAFPVSTLTMGTSAIGTSANSNPITAGAFIGRGVANIIPFGYPPSAAQPLVNSGKVPAWDFGINGMVLNGTAETFGLYWNQTTASGHQIYMLISEDF